MVLFVRKDNGSEGELVGLIKVKKDKIDVLTCVLIPRDFLCCSYQFFILDDDGVRNKKFALVAGRSTVYDRSYDRQKREWLLVSCDDGHAQNNR